MHVNGMHECCMLGTGVAGTILRHLVQAAARLFRVTATRGVTIAIANRR